MVIASGSTEDENERKRPVHLHRPYCPSWARTRTLLISCQACRWHGGGESVRV
jgi:hypothetical protein